MSADCRYCRTTPNGGETACKSLAGAHDCPWMSRSDWEAFEVRQAASHGSAGGEPIAALRDIVSWKEDVLGDRSKPRGPYDCAPEITEAFDRGARMAFYRCAARASAALSPPVKTGRDADTSLQNPQTSPERPDLAQAVPDSLRTAAERVCWFDWSDNDMDACAAMDALRRALTMPSADGGTAA